MPPKLPPRPRCWPSRRPRTGHRPERPVRPGRTQRTPVAVRRPGSDAAAAMARTQRPPQARAAGRAAGPEPGAPCGESPHPGIRSTGRHQAARSTRPAQTGTPARAGCEGARQPPQAHPAGQERAGSPKHGTRQRRAAGHEPCSGAARRRPHRHPQHLAGPEPPSDRAKHRPPQTGAPTRDGRGGAGSRRSRGPQAAPNTTARRGQSPPAATAAAGAAETPAGGAVGRAGGLRAGAARLMWVR